MTVKRRYSLNTDDKRLIDDAIHIAADGSIRKLSRILGRSEPYLRHVLAGRVEGLDPSTRLRLQHLIVCDAARQMLIEVLGDRWQIRTQPVLDHLLTCPACLMAAIIQTEKHFRDVANNRAV